MPVLKWSKELTTTDGRKARLLANNLKGDRSYVVAVEDDSGREVVFTYPADGKYLQNSETGADLTNAPKKLEGVFNAYYFKNETRAFRNEATFYLQGPCNTRDDADSNADLKKRIARIRVKFAEGQMDD